MLKFPALCRAAAITLLAAAPFVLLATETHVWEQSDAADFEHGTRDHVSLGSNGKLTLAPETKEVDSTNTPYLWAVVEDSRGAVYYAGGAPTGATTNIYVYAPGAKPHKFAELNGLEVHAMAVDRQDRLYAAVQPDAKIYRIGHDGKPELFFDPHAKYVWAMTFDGHGDLFVATGDEGLIYRVRPDGKGDVFAHTNETHARSMILDGAGNLIVGTEPGGLIERISPDGKTFIVLQTRKREVTALAERGGVVYAASVGTRPASVSGPAPLLPSAPPPVSPSGAPHVTTAPPAAAPAVGSLSASVSGGSDVYAIQSDGSSERVWESNSDIVYAIAFDNQGLPLLGTGNKGVLYRVDSNHTHTELLNAPPTQVTGLLQSRKGVLYMITGNVGNLYAIGPGSASSGSYVSEVLDAGEFAYWGKIHVTGNAQHGTIGIEARSGNWNNPQQDWSAWARVPFDRLGGKVTAPAARFLQYRLTLTRSPEGASPEVNLVDIPYLPKNLAPNVLQVEVAPVNYRPSTSSTLERTTVPSGWPVTLTLPAIGQHTQPPSLLSNETSGGMTLQYAKGFLTVRWSASDPNHDPLQYKIELRGKDDARWRTLKDALQETHFAIDSSAFADGEYVARVTASDAPGNPPGQALTASLESTPFTIDNTPPVITGLQVQSGTVRFTAKDALSWIAKAEFSVNGGNWQLLEPVDKVTDSQVLSYEIPVQSGELVAVRVFDENDNVAVQQIAAP